MTENIFTATIDSSAIKSECGHYRYVLKRVWEPTKVLGAFLCANPSKADHLLLDATVFKCMNLAVQWGWGGLHVLNLFPQYETDQKKLVHDEGTDKTNAEYVTKIFKEVETIVIATGNAHQQRLKELLQGVAPNKLCCLRKNKGGGFLHPSRIKPEDFKQPIKIDFLQ